MYTPFSHRKLAHANQLSPIDDIRSRSGRNQRNIRSYARKALCALFCKPKMSHSIRIYVASASHPMEQHCPIYLSRARFVQIAYAFCLASRIVWSFAYICVAFTTKKSMANQNDTACNIIVALWFFVSGSLRLWCWLYDSPFDLPLLPGRLQADLLTATTTTRTESVLRGLFEPIECWIALHDNIVR